MPIGAVGFNNYPISSIRMQNIAAADEKIAMDIANANTQLLIANTMRDSFEKSSKKKSFSPLMDLWMKLENIHLRYQAENQLYSARNSLLSFFRR